MSYDGTATPVPSNTTTTVTPAARKALRVLETYGRTFGAAFVAQLILSGFDVSTLTDMSQAKKLGVAAVAAGLQALLSALGLTLGKSGTVSLLPARLDPATPPVVDPQSTGYYGG
jgi:hypothetical protein